MKIQVWPKDNKITLTVWGTYWSRDLDGTLTGGGGVEEKKLKIITVDLSDTAGVEDLWDVKVEVK
jgi:hypothetical protein